MEAAERTRKRLRSLDTWSNCKRRKAVQGGQEHLSSSGSGRIIRKKEMQAPCGGHCRLRCSETFPVEERRPLFEKFYSMSDNEKTAFICGAIRTLPVKRRYHQRRTSSPNSSRRQKTFQFYLTHADGSGHQVCKKMFQATYDLSNGRISRALMGKANNSGMPTSSQRGKKTPKRVDGEQRNRVRDHINRFPKSVSHYSRRDNPNSYYLSSDLSIRRMYHLYKELCTEDGVRPVKESFYRHVFNTEFNLKFHHPRSDSCNSCDKFKIEHCAAKCAEEKSRIMNMWNLHKAKAEAAYAELKLDTETAKAGVQSIVVICFDMQQTMPLPKVTAGDAYYCRQLNVYNLGVHNCATDKASMFLWTEQDAKKGSEEVASCLWHYLESEVPIADKLIAWSDSCPGQNKNHTLLSFFHYLVSRGKYKEIVHKFLVPGHTFMPVDRDFSIIEQVKKKKEYIFTPTDWYDIVRFACKKRPFSVVEMTQDDFLSFGNVSSKLIKRMQTIDKQPARFSKVMRFAITVPKVTRVSYNHGALQPEYELNHERARGRKYVLDTAVLSKKYNSPLPLKAAKLKDLKTLMKYVPEVSQVYYQQLFTNQRELTANRRQHSGTVNEEEDDDNDSLCDDEEEESDTADENDD